VKIRKVALVQGLLIGIQAPGVSGGKTTEDMLNGSEEVLLTGAQLVIPSWQNLYIQPPLPEMQFYLDYLPTGDHTTSVSVAVKSVIVSTRQM
jgi:hypothetical protein